MKDIIRCEMVMLLFLTVFILFGCEQSSFYFNKEHSFLVRYPQSFITEQLKYNEEVYRANAGEYGPWLSVSVMDQKDFKLDDTPDYLTKKLVEVENGTNFTFISKRRTQLKDGTPAYEVVCYWDSAILVGLNTMILMSIKNNKAIGVSVTTVGPIDDYMGDYKKVPYSLTFGKSKDDMIDKVMLEEAKTAKIDTIKKEDKKIAKIVKVEKEDEKVAMIDKETGKMRVAVMDFRPKGVTNTIAVNVSEMVMNEMINSGRFTVLERSQVKMILKEQGFQQTGCTDVSCAVKVGQLLSARKILIGSVMKIGKTIVISGRIVDVEKGVGERAANQDADSIEGLFHAAGKFTQKLTNIK